MSGDKATFASEVANAEKNNTAPPVGTPANPVYLPAPGDVIEAFYVSFTTPPVDQDGLCSQLVAPVTGQIVAINTELDDHPNIVNEDPYHEGWLIEVELNDQSELEGLLDADEYDALISGEEEA